MRGEPLTILLVEDNPDHAELVLRSLRRHRVANTIHHVSDGEVALDYLLRRGSYSSVELAPRPHVILLDLRLPKIDGIEVLHQLKDHAELKRIPVVILTTSTAERDVVKAYDAHVNSYLVKPVDFDKFQQMMVDLGFYWLCWNQQPDSQSSDEWPVVRPRDGR